MGGWDVVPLLVNCLERRGCMVGRELWQLPVMVAWSTLAAVSCLLYPCWYFCEECISLDSIVHPIAVGIQGVHVTPFIVHH